jgi:hypothetical protein
MYGLKPVPFKVKIVPFKLKPVSIKLIHYYPESLGSQYL